MRPTDTLLWKDRLVKLSKRVKLGEEKLWFLKLKSHSQRWEQQERTALQHLNLRLAEARDCAPESHTGDRRVHGH